MYLNVLRKACKKLVEVKKVLTTDFVLGGKTTYIYDVGQTEFSWENPGEIQGLGESGTLNFTVEGVNLSIPIDIPLYAWTSTYDELCYKDGVWGIKRGYSHQIYDGSEDWEMYANNRFRVVRPTNADVLSGDNYYKAFISTHTSKQCSYTYLTSYETAESAIAIGTTYLAVKCPCDTLEDFKAHLNKYPMKVLYGINGDDEDNNIWWQWQPLPDNVQRYLNSYVK